MKHPLAIHTNSPCLSEKERRGNGEGEGNVFNSHVAVPFQSSTCVFFTHIRAAGGDRNAPSSHLHYLNAYPNEGVYIVMYPTTYPLYQIFKVIDLIVHLWYTSPNVVLRSAYTLNCTICRTKLKAREDKSVTCDDAKDMHPLIRVRIKVV